MQAPADHETPTNGDVPMDGSAHARAPLPSPGFDAATTLQAAFTHHQAGRVSEAAELYKQILASDATHADALHFLGVLACDVGNLPAGLNLIEQSIQLHPNAIYLNNLGNMRGRARDRQGAIAAYRAALSLAPDYADALSNLGYALREEGDSLAAIVACKQAVRLKPEHAQAWINLGNALLDLGSDEEALESYIKALALNPNDANAHNNVGNIQEKYGRAASAAESYQRALALEPGRASLHNNLGNVLRDQGRLDQATASYRRAVALDPGFAQAHSNLLLLLNTRPDVSLREQFDEACAFGAHQSAKAQPFQHIANADDAGRRLRIGFVSGDLNSHPVGFFLESVLGHLDRTRIELVAYATRKREDAVSQRLMPQFSAWHDVSRLDDAACARRIRDDAIDILVDLSGHTNHNRLPVFAWKPAPVQATWLGYFATTGLAAIDYVIADRYVLPFDEASQCVEAPWHLPDSYLCFTPPPFDIGVGPLPASANSAITFGCFNHLVKLNDAVVALWARVLDAVPGSRLLLKTRQLDDPSVQHATLARFAAHGIDGARLMLEGQSPRAELLAAYNRVDIALDPFPYAGGTTSVEALWMGVPVLTRRGERFLSHVGESIVNTAGLTDWIASDDTEYVAKAVRLGAQRDELAMLRRTLRERLLASPLCDAPRFARHLEDAFHGMWARHVACHQANDGQPAQPHRHSSGDARHAAERNFA
ncbi:tetratricopeptide repeat protein [Paraburkholderia sp. Tr-20389]|uniref:O-linked N-acetylglucosamine transferase, SPINDLY family protein n=1 Tax=Paraburkholderia sp. Tr-20389 TaxID=2703903 RepID=UPI00197E54DF|nr:tetratricopeptide repeat protein [Paraburkholderia sp. Tr-20389]MBN3752831.1 tetratricopeptide repeat protein [Paraburkholderia sp. Tr-20389]